MHFRQAPKQKRQPLSRAGTFEDLCAFFRTLTHLALGKRSAVYLKIPFEHARLMRQVLNMAFREAERCSDPSLFGGTGALRDAVSRLHASIDQQLRRKGVPE
jgi:hypothetical protein